MALQLPIGHHNEEEAPAYRAVPGALSPVNGSTPTARKLQKEDGQPTKGKSCLAKALIGLGSGLLVGAAVTGVVYYQATQPAGFDFVKVTSGSCVSNGLLPIKDLGTCSKAVKALLLPVAQVELVPHESMDGLDRSLAFDVPEDCYFLSIATDPPRHTLFFNEGYPGGEATAASVHGSVTREPICVKPDTPKSATTIAEERLKTKKSEAKESDKKGESAGNEDKGSKVDKKIRPAPKEEVTTTPAASIASVERPEFSVETSEKTAKAKAALRGSHDEKETPHAKPELAEESIAAADTAKAKATTGKTENEEAEGEDEDKAESDKEEDEEVREVSDKPEEADEDKDSDRAQKEKQWLGISK
mmetsp:Transcript_20946/g.45266  ORF Transcript_20946/g.45266 Transcript_20946/m.45266 type:complete len:360 (+) Transcript_20946:169-1248(+)|eukprot:CAMPEP_0206470290 /NCGR_PEP_ID=MMETSP0324_2-20121206/30840_1 /ASSEMBLY_ACC=CAM_ASM_000836 /TAXON_ID=2866 /ORGANISM="Crypthecodinium cohnii, Strain Seligo" /LENGTH=359 /DNA_ID=CAMNT_0053944317 /DNA_START=124 /DNA_END=1203 /DNA_ORIENTATION=+